MKSVASRRIDLRFPLAIAVAIAVGSSPVWISYLSTYVTEASPRAYADATWIPSRCPPAVPSLRRALADRRLTRREAIDLGRELEDRSNARSNAQAMRTVGEEVGGALPPIPPRCSTSRKDEGDYSSPLLRHSWDI